MTDQTRPTHGNPMPLHEGEYQPDFELLSAYQSFSAELLRLSMLGLGAIGVLMGLFGNEVISDFGRGIVECANPYVFLAAIGAFVAAAACALWHRYDSTDSMSSYILLLRSKRRGPDAAARVAEEQENLNRKLKSSSVAIAASAICLVIATLLLGAGFWYAMNPPAGSCPAQKEDAPASGATG